MVAARAQAEGRLRQAGEAACPGDASVRVGGVVNYDDVSSSFSMGCGGGSKFCDAGGRQSPPRDYEGSSAARESGHNMRSIHQDFSAVYQHFPFTTQTPSGRKGSQTTTGYAGAASLQNVLHSRRLPRSLAPGAGVAQDSSFHPRPINGILVAITVMNCTLASSGRFAM